MKITKEQMIDSAKFANFAQKVKVQVWDKMRDPQDEMPAYAEKYLDEILLIAFKELKNINK